MNVPKAIIWSLDMIHPLASVFLDSLKMRFAYIDGHRIDIKDYKDDMAGKIMCAEGHPIIAKRGQIRIHHFAHKVHTQCSCHDNKGEWHIWWQDRVLPEHQEVRLQASSLAGGSPITHIADILIPAPCLSGLGSGCKGHIIEIQHSPMDLATIRAREAFYTGQGYSL